jgi:tRNA(Glu) U13 pseudouridine synthase TruD
VHCFCFWPFDVLQDDVLPSDWTELQQQQGPQSKRQRKEQQQQQQLLAPVSEEVQPGEALGEQQEAQEQEAPANGKAVAEVASTSGRSVAIESQKQLANNISTNHKLVGGSDASKESIMGVVLEFTLPSSCYATMLIRELTKSSTSKASHREMSTRDRGATAAPDSLEL